MIRHAILSVIMNSLVLWGVTVYMPDYLTIEGGLLAFLLPALLLGILNSLLKPLLKLVSLPLIVLTAGFFSVVINAIVLAALVFLIKIFAAFDVSFVVNGGIVGYIVTAFVLAVMDSFVHWLIKKN